MSPTSGLNGSSSYPESFAELLREGAGAVEPQVRLDAVEPAQRERDLGQVRVPGTLPHAVDGALDPPRAGAHRREGSCRREAEVVVPVEVNRDVRAEPLPRLADEVCDRFGARDADRVDDDRFLRARFDRRLVDRLEVAGIGARAVDAEEGDS